MILSVEKANTRKLKSYSYCEMYIYVRQLAEMQSSLKRVMRVRVSLAAGEQQVTYALTWVPSLPSRLKSSYHEDFENKRKSFSQGNIYFSKCPNRQLVDFKYIHEFQSRDGSLFCSICRYTGTIARYKKNIYFKM